MLIKTADDIVNVDDRINKLNRLRFLCDGVYFSGDEALLAVFQSSLGNFRFRLLSKKTSFCSSSRATLFSNREDVQNPEQTK